MTTKSTHRLFILLFYVISFFGSDFNLTDSSQSCGWSNHFPRHNNEFKQKTDIFYQFDSKSNTWVEVKLPYDLITCNNGNCTKVGIIQKIADKTVDDDHTRQEESDASHKEKQNLKKDGEQKIIEEKMINYGHMLLPVRKRVSLNKLSELSILVTGESGSIYERFWNGAQWVIIPHHLPESAGGHAVSVFIVNQTLLALSDAGFLYQIQLIEKAQPAWTEISVTPENNIEREVEQRSKIQIKSGLISHDRKRAYFCTKTGSLLELVEVEPPRWIDYGRPPGGDVAGIAAVTSMKPESTVFIISSAGDLYEHNHNSKPSWKKHIQIEGQDEDSLLISTKGCSLEGLNGAYSLSIFLINKAGKLVERRLSQKKWKWIVHGSPLDQLLTSITPFNSQDESVDGKLNSLLLTTAFGSVFEYRLAKSSGSSDQDVGNTDETWLNHMHPPHAKVAKGLQGIQYQIGRFMFPLDDGRLGELHLPGLGGENSGPNQHAFIRRKSSSSSSSTTKYVWSILDAPETEGWNAEYCKEERGPSNCMIGITDGGLQHDLGSVRFTRRRRRKGRNDHNLEETSYLSATALVASKTSSVISGGGQPEEFFKKYSDDNWIRTNFRLRVMHPGRSFFLIDDDGRIFEYLYNDDNVWMWLHHEHPTPIKGAVGTYKESLFLVDVNGNLLIRERSSRDGLLGWINCTDMRKGKHIIGGPPWNNRKVKKIAAEDSLFFTGKNGTLLQLTVSNRKYKWKDCKTPPNTKTATIVDQEVLRDNIIFTVGNDGQLYQYNKLYGLWHKHHQSPHLVLSSRLPGTAARSASSALSLKGSSLFMISEDGGLVEYHWNAGWSWVEHGTPHEGVRFNNSAPGPCFEGNQLFLVGSDGNVYLRYLDQSEWKWNNCSSPYLGNGVVEEQRQEADICPNKDYKVPCLEYREATSHHTTTSRSSTNRNCDTKVAYTRPIPFADNSVIFELRDGRLAELRRVKEYDWTWSHILATPTSSCMTNSWTMMAS